ncbi:copper chaperone PCu(A)C [Rhodopseudomonas sp. WA056]|uniref:copper chaperone PCu(A)C n=1 Tax=Rhodopseudomonas sp. WA056 TaxID=2269367 RepID=UPI0013DFAC19|nr:copper chaperone PCu(A)C [Rhodopseudomonas sp. WA056]NEW87175.1 copper chaperone PCu(A)C [Rhodopseudomonas sp. WA056]
MNFFIRSVASVAIATVLSTAAVQAAEVKAGDLVISKSWSRATPGGAKVAGGFLTIENKGSSADRLVAGSADIAGKVEIHEMSMDNGVMKMRPLDNGLAIEPGKTVTLMPGSYHIMLMDLKGPLKQGDKVPVTLEFEKAGKVQLTLDVEGVGAKAPGDAGGSMMKMDHGTMDHSGHGMKK